MLYITYIYTYMYVNIYSEREGEREREREREGERARVRNTISKLNLVDLAGSERNDSEERSQAKACADDMTERQRNSNNNICKHVAISLSCIRINNIQHHHTTVCVLNFINRLLL